MASGMAALSDLIEGGTSHNDAVVKLFEASSTHTSFGKAYDELVAAGIFERATLSLDSDLTHSAAEAAVQAITQHAVNAAQILGRSCGATRQV